ncbi:hypothetical protein I6A62_28650 [Frankia sp. AgW1.1]|nr:hypothetical protein [Frankia sp. AgW1.1]
MALGVSATIPGPKRRSWLVWWPARRGLAPRVDFPITERPGSGPSHTLRSIKDEIHHHHVGLCTAKCGQGLEGIGRVGETAEVSNRPRPGQLSFIDQVARDFSFLVRDWGFTGPFVRPDKTVIFDRADLRIGVWSWTWRNDFGFETDIAEVQANADGEHRYGELERLYVGAKLGPARDVTGGGSRSIIKRCALHAVALQKLMPMLAGPEWDDLVTRFGSTNPALTLFDPTEVHQRSPGGPDVEPGTAPKI